MKKFILMLAAAMLSFTTFAQEKTSYDETYLPAKYVTDKAKPTLVMITASWCGPCKMVAPILHEIEKELPDLVIAKVNVDELTSVAIKYGIQSIPTLIVMQNGEVVNKAVGFRTKEQIIDLLK